MQLSWAPVGYGVVESRVESGQVTRHPVKRFRTTFSYIAVALLGTDEDRAHLRAAVNRAHAQVRSTADSPVEYHAMRPDLQLWVAACLYWGAVDLYTRLHGPMEPAVADAFYRHAARFGTTLQVRQQMWPADRAVFERYWQEALGRVSLDDTVRRYLHDLITRRSLRFPFNLGPRGPRVFLTTGFLPPRFRAEMGLAWSEEQQARFDRLLRRIGAVSRRMPRAVRLFPFNLLLWDVRRRIRQGRPLV
ncbi:MAG: DUF2236 domain-containing protein [Frankia sp.]|nr:DUF2236 domain-containing protein [Frankia sp.]